MFRSFDIYTYKEHDFHLVQYWPKCRGASDNDKTVLKIKENTISVRGIFPYRHAEYTNMQ